MKLKFETWIEENQFSENARNLLKASSDCYKAQVYSASLLMGYLGFLVVLKERVMTASKPQLFPQGLWDKLITNLKNEDKWEESIFDASIQQEKTDGGRPAMRTQDPIFVINDNLRTQIRYWKDRRNDCVHNKDNLITISHVESFWSFLESNLPKITIEGGKTTLINKFKRHYDRTYTSSNESVDPLIKEIKSAVRKVEMQEFWKELFEDVSDLWDYTNEIQLINKIIALNDTMIINSLIEYLKADKNLLKAYINDYPSMLLLLEFNKHEIRNFWSTQVINMHNAIGVYASILRNNLIPEEEIIEANEKFSTLDQYPESADDHFVLYSNGFGDALYNRLFVKNNPNNRKYWQYMNNHCGIFRKYIEHYELKDEVVKIICDEFGKTDWVSWHLRSSLEDLFADNSKKKKEFIEKASKMKLVLPEGIESLHS